MNTNALAPLRLHVLSDLHFGVVPAWFRLAPGADVMVVAGDFREGLAPSIEVLRRVVPRPTPIVFVAGNHEFYDECLPEQLASAGAVAAEHDVTFLDNGVAVIGGVRFLGCTLWTDYALFGEANRTSAMEAARSGMDDHYHISMRTKPKRKFQPSHALAIHQASRRWLVEALALPFDGPTVVVTHHAPTPQSVHPQFADDPVTPAFVSDMTDVVEASGAALWVHGHTHSPFDYRVGGTRVFCNPKGYGRENPAFQPEMVVEVER